MFIEAVVSHRVATVRSANGASVDSVHNEVSTAMTNVRGPFVFSCHSTRKELFWLR